MAEVLSPAEVLELVDDLGITAKITTYTETYEPSTGANSWTDPVEHTHKISIPTGKIRFIPDDLVEEGDMETLLPASGLDPVLIPPPNGTHFEVDSRVWQVVARETIYVGEIEGATAPSVGGYVLLLRGGASGE